MRIVIVALALALSGCGGSKAVNNWKHTARLNCEKEVDPIQRQTCRERVDAVTATAPRPEDGDKKHH
ncbi:MAG: hypothetical protein WDN76_10165 [Alphaproteobacteria bacterium]